MHNGLELAQLAAEILRDNKAEEVLILNVNEQLGITDFFVIATGQSRPHLKFLRQELKKQLKKSGNRTPEHLEGEAEQGWLLADYEEVIIHLFNEEKRQYYNLEELWADAPRVSA
ncbi:MAG: ribosome silencing factor [bacterium]